MHRCLPSPLPRPHVVLRKPILSLAPGMQHVICTRACNTFPSPSHCNWCRTGPITEPEAWYIRTKILSTSGWYDLDIIPGTAVAMSAFTRGPRWEGRQHVEESRARKHQEENSCWSPDDIHHKPLDRIALKPAPELSSSQSRKPINSPHCWSCLTWIVYYSQQKASYLIIEASKRKWGVIASTLESMD